MGGRVLSGQKTKFVKIVGLYQCSSIGDDKYLDDGFNYV